MDRPDRDPLLETPPAAATHDPRPRARIGVAIATALLLVLPLTARPAGHASDVHASASDVSDPTEAVVSAETRVSNSVAPTTTAPATAPTTTAPTTTAPPPTTTSPTTTSPTAPAPRAAPPPTTACVEGHRGSVPDWGDEREEFDPATVARTSDPSGRTCRPVTRVLVVGDSTGTGTANGLRRLRAPDLEIWDRTKLGCGVVVSVEGCPDFRTHWSSAVRQLRPDVVLVYAGVSADVVDGVDPPFLAETTRQVRIAALSSAVDTLRSSGARVMWALPARVLERGVFFCGGLATGSHCDPAWTARWHEDLRTVAAARGMVTVDVDRWVSFRSATLRIDRPDGLHMSGPALDAQAAWLAEHLRHAVR